MATYSSLSDARTPYLANADYAEANDLVKAKAFTSARRALLLILSKQPCQLAQNTVFVAGHP
jgi:hypothetical protein